MNVELLKEADQELTEAALWYESKEPGFGKRFRNEITHVIGHIASGQLLWREQPGVPSRPNALRHRGNFLFFTILFIHQYTLAKLTGRTITAIALRPPKR